MSLIIRAAIWFCTSPMYANQRCGCSGVSDDKTRWWKLTFTQLHSSYGHISDEAFSCAWTTHGVQRVLVLAPPVRGCVCACHCARALFVPHAQVVREVDVDVPVRAHGLVRVWAAHAGIAVQGQARKDTRGGRIPRDVLSLHLSKPQGFLYMSGQYILVNCATVSPFVW
jgi:hypothetical protein